MSSTAASWNQARDGVFAQPPEWLLDCSFTEENAAGFALGALEPDEQLRVAHHVSWCPACAHVLHEARKVAGYLSFLAPQATPPASAKASLFARIAAERVPVASVDAPATPEPPVGPYDDLLRQPLDDRMASDIAPSRRPASKRRLAWEAAAAPLAAVPLVFALAIVGGFALHTQNKLNDQIAYANSLQAENVALHRQQDSAVLLNQPMNEPMDLETPNSVVGDKMGGELSVSEDGTALQVSVWSMPSDTQWVAVVGETPSGAWETLKTFQVNDDGAGKVEFQLPTPLSAYRAVHVVRSEGDKQTVYTDSAARPKDLLWRSLDGNLGDVIGTEANLNAH